MENKDFYYRQYDKLDWSNQERTKINGVVNKFIIENIIAKKPGSGIKVYDIGFGIGLLLKMIHKALAPKYKRLVIEGCEPSEKNYEHFTAHPLKTGENTEVKTQCATFLNAETTATFDFVTAVYVFPHILFEEMAEVLQKIHTMLEPGGQFIMVVVNEAYLEKKLSSNKNLLIEKYFVEFDKKQYQEILHYSELPEIGKVIDYNREESFYIAMFTKYGFRLAGKTSLNDSGDICTVFTFQKK